MWNGSTGHTNGKRTSRKDPSPAQHHRGASKKMKNVEARYVAELGDKTSHAIDHCVHERHPFDATLKVHILAQSAANESLLTTCLIHNMHWMVGTHFCSLFAMHFICCVYEDNVVHQF